MIQRSFFLIGCFLVFLGCANAVSKEDLFELNGYWEIEQVVFPDGNTKDYTVNTTVDYIEWKGSEGFRKKMNPKFDGTFETSDDAKAFTISEKDGNFTMHYKTPLSEWSEQLVALGEDRFSVVNEAGLQYDYKRFEPISIDE